MLSTLKTTLILTAGLSMASGEDNCVQAWMDDWCVENKGDGRNYARWNNQNYGWHWRCCAESGSRTNNKCMGVDGKLTDCPEPEVGTGDCYSVYGTAGKPETGPLGLLAAEKVGKECPPKKTPPKPDQGCIQSIMDDWCVKNKGNGRNYARWNNQNYGWHWRCCQEKGTRTNNKCMTDSGKVGPCLDSDVGTGDCYSVYGTKNDPKTGSLGQLAMASVELCTWSPTAAPTTADPTKAPTMAPTTANPTPAPTPEPTTANPTDAPTWVPTPAPTGPEYIKTARKETECPAGYKKPESSMECRKACKALGWERDVHGDRDTQPFYPSGCIENTLYCYFNKSTGNQSNGSRSVVCQRKQELDVPLH